MSGVPEPELVEDAACEFGSPKLRKRALTLPVVVWLGLYMALERAASIEKALVSAWGELRALVAFGLPLPSVLAYRQPHGTGEVDAGGHRRGVLAQVAD